jgi:hypothetical protein
VQDRGKATALPDPKLNGSWIGRTYDQNGDKRKNENDWKTHAPSKTHIYPASRFKYEDTIGQVRELRCGACGEQFTAKRKDAVYCGAACRKWRERNPRRPGSKSRSTSSLSATQAPPKHTRMAAATARRTEAAAAMAQAPGTGRSLPARADLVAKTIPQITSQYFLARTEA